MSLDGKGGPYLLLWPDDSKEGLKLNLGIKMLEKYFISNLFILPKIKRLLDLFCFLSVHPIKIFLKWWQIGLFVWVRVYLQMSKNRRKKKVKIRLWGERKNSFFPFFRISSHKSFRWKEKSWTRNVGFYTLKTI